MIKKLKNWWHRRKMTKLVVGLDAMVESGKHLVAALDKKTDIIGVMDTIDASTWIEFDGRKTVKHECDLCSKCVSNLIRYKCGDHESIKCNCDDGEWVKTNDGFTWKSKPNKPTNDYSDSDQLESVEVKKPECFGASIMSDSWNCNECSWKLECLHEMMKLQKQL